MRRALFVVLAAIAALGITALASAGGKPPTNPNNPVISFVSPSPAAGAVLEDGDVAFAFTFNRTPKQVASVTCALSGEASLSGACDTPVSFPANSKNTSKSGESYTDLANGDYTFTITLALTGGGVYSASRDFTVDAFDTTTCAVTNTTTANAYSDLQVAVDDADAGGELEIRGTCVGLFTISKNLTLTGVDVGSFQATLDGNGSFAVVYDGCTTRSLTVNDLTVQNGQQGFGSCFGSLTLNGSSLVTDTTLDGIGAASVEVTLNDSASVTGNTGFGSGITTNFGNVVLNDSASVSGNHAVAQEISPGNFIRGVGGGISTNHGSVTLNGSASVSGNTADQRGGGIYTNGGTVTLNGSASVSGNTAGVTGGGIYNNSGVVTINDSASVSGNTPNDIDT